MFDYSDYSTRNSHNILVLIYICIFYAIFFCSVLIFSIPFLSSFDTILTREIRDFILLNFFLFCFYYFSILCIL
jgi:hypothetical protein